MRRRRGSAVKRFSVALVLIATFALILSPTQGYADDADGCTGNSQLALPMNFGAFCQFTLDNGPTIVRGRVDGIGLVGLEVTFSRSDAAHTTESARCGPSLNTCEVAVGGDSTGDPGGNSNIICSSFGSVAAVNVTVSCDAISFT